LASKDGFAEYPVIKELQNYPQRFTFFQAVSLLENYCGTEKSADVGYYGPTNQEVVRFRPYASLAFASADLKNITLLESDGGMKFRMEVNFIGLYGTVSPLPAFYTESIIQNPEVESNRRDFLDLFHHRAISLHYRILRKYLLFNRIQPGLQDDVSNWLFSLIGLRGATSLDKPPLKRLHRLLGNLGLLLTRNRSGAVVSRIISHYFGKVPVRVEEFIEQEVKITTRQQVFLGVQQSTLGKDMTIGNRMLDRAGKFRLWIGPLPYKQFSNFLPSASDHYELVTLIRYLLQDPLAFDIGLILKKKAVPEFNLAKENPCGLGWSTWLGKPPKGDKHIIVGRNN